MAKKKRRVPLIVRRPEPKPVEDWVEIYPKKKKPKKNKLKKDKLEKARKHFKVNLERIAIHIGKIIDNTSVKDLAEVGLMASLAYAGYEVWGDWKASLFGPVALKLAQSPGGTPPVSQLAGVAGLSYLGLCFTGGAFGSFLSDPIGAFKTEGDLIKKRGGALYVKPTEEGACPEGMVRMFREGYASICVDRARVRGYERWGWSI